MSEKKKPVITEVTMRGGGYSISMDGPWDSEEDKAAFQLADDKYNELVEEGRPYVALIRSHHEYSHGYWIEFTKKKLSHYDLILKEHTS